MSHAETGGGLLPIVTLWASYGCGLDEVSPALAEELGVPFHRGAFSSDDLHEAEARGANGEPSGDGWYLVQAVYPRGRRFQWGNRLKGVKRDLRDEREALIAAVRHDARRGGVFSGRNGTVILADHPTAVHVKLDGPLEARIRKAMSDFGISEEKARDEQRFEDDVRSQLSITLFDWDPMTNDRYDLVVNTTSLTLDETVAAIAGAARARLEAATAASR